MKSKSRIRYEQMLQAQFRGLNVRKFNFVRNREYYKVKCKLKEQYTKPAFSDLVKIDTDFYKWLKDMYRLTFGETRYYIFDPKRCDYIGKMLKTVASKDPTYLISRKWLVNELYATNSPTLEKFLKDNMQFVTEIDEHVEKLKQDHIKLMNVYRIRSFSSLMHKNEDLEVIDEEEDSV